MINNTTLVGRLTRDPELRYTQSGIATARFTIAVDRPFTGQDGKREADFINCVVWRKQAENVAQYLKKGSLAGVVGRIQTGSYEKDGQKVYTVEVVADSVRFLDTKNAGGNGDTASTASTASSEEPVGVGAGTTSQSDPFAGGSIDLSDDDLPF